MRNALVTPFGMALVRGERRPQADLGERACGRIQALVGLQTWDTSSSGS